MKVTPSIIALLDETIIELQRLKTKMENGLDVENDDWWPATIPFNKMTQEWFALIGKTITQVLHEKNQC